MYKTIESAEEFKKNEYLEGKSIVAFRAVWCGPCQMIGPELEKLAEENSNVNVFDLDVDKFIDLAREMNVSHIPSLFYYRDGKLVSQSVGYLPAEEILNNLNK